MKLDVAKFRLMNSYPFFGVLLYNTPVERNDEVGTLATDGEKIYYNQAFWDKLSDSEKLGSLCHELGHLFLLHPFRQKGRDALAVDPQSGHTIALWNIAGDYVVNDLIKQSRPTTTGGMQIQLSKGSLWSEKYQNKTTDEVYNDLLKSMKKMSEQDIQNMMKGQSCNCNGTKWGKAGQGSSQKKKDLEGKWKDLGKQAIEHAKDKGTLPASLERLFKDLEPKEDWRKVLMEYAQPFNNDYSFNPSDRRFLSEDFVLPDIKDGQKIDWIAVAIDTSGSIGNRELNAFISEIKGIMESFERVKIKVTFCDSEATPFIELDEFEQGKIKPVGGGGTDFGPVFNMIKKEPQEPLALIYFTDTYGDYPSHAPYYDTLWIATENYNEKVPFGKLLPYKV